MAENYFSYLSFVESYESSWDFIKKHEKQNLNLPSLPPILPPIKIEITSQWFKRMSYPMSPPFFSQDCLSSLRSGFFIMDLGDMGKSDGLSNLSPPAPPRSHDNVMTSQPIQSVGSRSSD